MGAGLSCAEACRTRGLHEGFFLGRFDEGVMCRISIAFNASLIMEGKSCEVLAVQMGLI